MKSYSKFALVDILMKSKGPQGQSKALTFLDSCAGDSLTDISKSLIKLATQPGGMEMDGFYLCFSSGLNKLNMYLKISYKTRI